jgi:hypothetical protein
MATMPTREIVRIISENNGGRPVAPLTAPDLPGAPGAASAAPVGKTAVPAARPATLPATSKPANT